MYISNIFNIKKQAGFTLIELVIGISVSIFLTSGLIQFLVMITAKSHDHYDRLQLQHELNTALTMIKRDIKRAGYWHWKPGSGLSVFDNPFMSTELTPTLSRANETEFENSCITFSYDLDQDGSVSQNKMEFFGYRHHNGALEMRSNSGLQACNEGTWQDITTSTIVISNLVFNIDAVQRDMLDSTSSCVITQPCINIQLVSISLAAHIRNKPNIQQQITGQVYIQNPVLFYG